jgi:copper(I)-binding protein
MDARTLAAAVALLAAGCEKGPAAPGVEVEHVWVRLPATAEQPGAGYFTMRANGARDELRAVTSQFGRVELHESKMAGGVSSMRALAAVRVEPGETTAFAPGGKHLMLFALSRSLKPGGTIALRFAFAKARPVTVEARLVGPGEGPPEHAGH